MRVAFERRPLASRMGPGSSISSARTIIFASNVTDGIVVCVQLDCPVVTGDVRDGLVEVPLAYNTSGHH